MAKTKALCAAFATQDNIRQFSFLLSASLILSFSSLHLSNDVFAQQRSSCTVLVHEYRANDITFISMTNYTCWSNVWNREIQENKKKNQLQNSTTQKPNYTIFLKIGIGVKILYSSGPLAYKNVRECEKLHPSEKTSSVLNRTTPLSRNSCMAKPHNSMLVRCCMKFDDSKWLWRWISVQRIRIRIYKTRVANILIGRVTVQAQSCEVLPCCARISTKCAELCGFARGPGPSTWLKFPYIFSLFHRQEDRTWI